MTHRSSSSVRHGSAVDGRIGVAIVGAYPLDPGVIRNGVEAVVVNLVEGLRQLPGVRLTVVSVTGDVSEEMVSASNHLTIHYLPSAGRLRNISLDMVNRFRVGRKLDELRPDIVHVHNHATYPFIGRGRPPYPIVTTVHGIIREEVKYEMAQWDWIRKGSRRLLEHMVLGRAQDVIAVSDYVRDTVQSMSRARITVIDNPVGDRFFQAGIARTHQRGRDARPSILFVGALSRLKNPLDLIRALEMVIRSGQRPQLRLAGAAPASDYFDALRRHVRDRSLEGDVTFLGQLSESDLLREYEGCTLVASASREETAGMVFQQAMAARVPVVGTAVGGVPFVVQHNVTGLLAPAGDVIALAAALRTLLENPSLRAQFGDAGHRIALQRFTPITAAARTLAVYKEMLRRASPTPGRPTA